MEHRGQSRVPIGGSFSGLLLRRTTNSHVLRISELLKAHFTTKAMLGYEFVTVVLLFHIK